MYGRRQIFRVSYPIFLGLLAQNLINVTDTAFLGHVGEVELGASAIGGLYYILFFTLAFGFSIGAQILMARRNGEGNLNRIGPLFVQGTLFSLGIAVLLLAVSLWSRGPVLRLMLSSEEIVRAAETFYGWRAWGLLFSFVNVMFRAFYVSVTRTRVLTLNAVVMASINILLDWLLIFGNAGFPKMGLEGAALASVLAEAGSLVFFVIHTRRTVDLEKYGLRFGLRLDPRLIGSILNVSVFLMVQQFVPLASWFVFFLAIEHLGQRELAIANVVRSLYILALIPINALSTTVNTLVSNAIGAGWTDRVRAIINRISGWSLGLALGCAAVMLVFPEDLLSVYTGDSGLVREAIPSLRVIAAAVVVAAVANVQFNGISGTGSARAALWLEMGAQAAYTAYILIACWWLKWPVEACFTCELLYYLLLLLLSLAYLRYGKWDAVRL